MKCMACGWEGITEGEFCLDCVRILCRSERCNKKEAGLYRRKALSLTEANRLLSKGYILSKHIGLYRGRQEEYILKPRYNESPEHFFVVKAIEGYIKKYTSKVTLFVSGNADIVFEWEKQKIA